MPLFPTAFWKRVSGGGGSTPSDNTLAPTRTDDPKSKVINVYTINYGPVVYFPFKNPNSNAMTLTRGVLTPGLPAPGLIYLGPNPYDIGSGVLHAISIVIPGNSIGNFMGWGYLDLHFPGPYTCDFTWSISGGSSGTLGTFTVNLL